MDHAASGKSLPISRMEHEQRLFAFGGHTNLPASLIPLSASAESELVLPLLSGIAKKFRIKMDSNIKIDRSIPLVPEEKKRVTVLIVGGSNAVNLNSSMLSNGLHTVSLAVSGWAINAINVSAILPSITESCAALDKDTPVILYMLDNSSFKCADADGEILPITKKDGVYHVVGSLEVSPEVSMKAVVFNLTKLIKACGNRRTYVLSPLPCYLNGPCCEDPSHCTHLVGPDCGIQICCALHRLNISLRNQLRDIPTCTLVITGDIIAGKSNSAPSEVLEATSSWGVVHGPKEAYDKIARHLVKISNEDRPLKRFREEPIVMNEDGSQRSRGSSFSNGVAAGDRTGGGGSRQGSQLISYPLPVRGRGRQGTSTSYY